MLIQVMKLKRCLPNMYKKDIFEIPYAKLKEMGIRCLLFDLDNTIALIDQERCDDNVKKLFKRLKKDFQILIISNNHRSRVLPYAEFFDVDYICDAKKPLQSGFRKVEYRYHHKREETCVIGDQLMTDILGGNKFGAFTILVDPLGEKDLKITAVNRFLERRVLKKYKKKKWMERGTYYE